GHHLPRGLRSPRALTAGQLDAAARFLGSTLAAAQGPPGTGKTDLILHLVADTLVARARRLLEGRAMGRTLLLVTSTNNRAVDNVLDPLARELPETALPLGLRAGNQEVTASLTAETLARARTWLRAQDTTDAAARHAAALAEFEGALEEVDQALAPFEVGQTERARRERLVSRLADLDEDLARAPGTLEEAEEAQRRLKIVRRVLVDLEQIVEKRTKSSVERALALWQRKAVEKDAVAQAEASLVPLEVTLDVRLPPSHADDDPEDEVHDAWEDAVVDALEAVEVARDAVQVILRAHQLRKQRDAVAAELAELELSVAEAPAAPPALAGPHANLFALANRVRETWAILHAGELEPALRRALERTAGRGSLRSIFEKDLETASWLRRLFPVMGCTLLSLGNVFPPEPGVVERVVVDEAGQCHPAYALAALMRAERALVIGDVHQLEPVVRLTGIDEQRVRRISDVDLSDAVLAPYRIHAENPTSAQSLADRAVRVRPQLRDHFRCQPAIIGLSDRLCGYQLAVHTPARSLVGQVPWLTDPVLLAAVEGQQVQARGSWANPVEADAVLEILRQLGRRGIPWTEIALLTPYVGQLELLRQRLRQVGVPLESDREAWSATQPALFETGALATGTVHRFQGGERTIVIFSTVVGRDRSLGFLNGRVNLINVAVSRARDHLIIVGDPAVLARGPHSRVLTDRAVRLAADAIR
ncbi:MAG: ATP-binding domain-containing protein, partial [Myxococcales bacterium]|nr:ATP-binding domain-containing protein [Myxococcales bacterium]